MMYYVVDSQPVSIDEKIMRLTQGLREKGVEPPEPPEDTKVLKEIDAAVAPLRLPAEVRRFWELVDPCSLRIEPYPHLTSPQVALELWQEQVADSPGVVPRVLFPIAYESHLFTFVEVHGDDGGALFVWGYTGPEDFQLTFLGIAGLLDDMLDALADNRYRDFGGTLGIRPHGAKYASSADQGPQGPHPVFGAIDSIPGHLDAWPESWLLRSGIGTNRRSAKSTPPPMGSPEA
jgi:hypothetical protein